jgi:hypothetical protein
MIAEAAYYFAEKRGFSADHSLEDWLTAEQQVRLVISPADEEVDEIAKQALEAARRK